MKRMIACSALSTLLLAASQALPCGGGFGTNVAIDPIQKIVISYRNGVETYIFNPYFCQAADSFGLILPVPAVLTQNPILSPSQLYADLATVAAPTIQTQTVCGPPPGAGGGSSTGGAGTSDAGNGTIVIQKGQVGIFEWSLLQATSTASFTDWLTTNGYPYQTSATATFDEYVKNAWYFIAFKVSVAGSSGTGGAGSTSTGTTSIKSGQTICGNFGPISLAFPRTSDPVVPARIAAVSSSQLTWTLYTLASQQMKLRDQSATLRFSGAIGSSEMSSYQSLSSVAQAGDRLTELQATLTASSAKDLVLEPDLNQADYRRVETQYKYVTCTGGSSSTGAGTSSGGTGAAPSSGGSGGGTVALLSGGTKASGGSNTIAGTLSVGGTGNASGGNTAVAGATSVGGTGKPSGGSTTIASTSSVGGTLAVLDTKQTGGKQSTGGAAVTGGVATVGGSSSAQSQAIVQGQDDGGCACTLPTRDRNPFAAGVLAALVGIGALRRKRR